MRFILGTSLPPHKQLKMAILEGNEAKALEIYTKDAGSTGNKSDSLIKTLHPSLPFPSNKIPADPETPLHMACKEGLAELVELFLKHQGNPAQKNDQHECSLHSVCSMQNNGPARSKICDALLCWRGTKGVHDPYALHCDAADVDGNTPIHYAAYNGLLQCVEVLFRHKASLAIVNKVDLSCLDMADKANFHDLVRKNGKIGTYHI